MTTISESRPAPTPTHYILAAEHDARGDLMFCTDISRTSFALSPEEALRIAPEDAEAVLATVRAALRCSGWGLTLHLIPADDVERHRLHHGSRFYNIKYGKSR